MPRASISATFGILIFTAVAGGTGAQTLTINTADVSGTLPGGKLAFSDDGRELRAHDWARASNSSTPVHLAGYDGRTGALLHQLTLPPYSRIESQTSDGRLLVVATDGPNDGSTIRLAVVDADTGESERIPAEWFDADDKWPSAEISGDGSLVSAYSESGPQESPMVVTLYDWKTKKQVAKQMHGFPAGGAAGGGVTEDGKIEFTYDRSGSDIVDPSTGRALLSAPIDSVRSPDGAWNVDFPATTYTDPGNEITIRHGDDGRAAGKLDIPVTEEQAGVPWPGAFCGNTGKFVTAIGDTVYVFRIPSGRKIETFAAESWRDPSAQDFPMTSLACSIDGKRLAIGSGARLTVRNLK